MSTDELAIERLAYDLAESYLDKARLAIRAHLGHCSDDILQETLADLDEVLTSRNHLVAKLVQAQRFVDLWQELSVGDSGT